jgi:hypothetical protein
MDLLIIKNMKLTISHETAITAKPIAAHFSIFKPSQYFFSSPPEVIILKPHRKQRAKAIKDNIPRTQLIAFLTVLIKESFCNFELPATPALYCVSCL